MTTTFPTDNRTIVNESDNTGDWTATDGPTAFSSSPSPIESTNCMGMNVSNTTEDAYDTITSDDWSNGSLFVWMRPFGTMDTTANGGAAIQVGDGTNRIAYHVGGSDVTGFRHESGPIEWSCFILDLGNKPANNTALAGTEGNLNEAAITQVGTYFTTIVKSVGGVENCFWDIIRWANPGDDVVMQGGTTSGAAGNGAEAAVVDRGTGNQQAYGVIRELGAGVYGIQGNLTIGNSASASDQFWEETNVTYSWEDRGLSSTNYYRFSIIGSSTATNCEASFTASTFVVPTAASASFDGNGADLTVCNMIGCTFIGFDQGIETSDDTGDDWTNCTFIGNDEIVANGCDLSGGTFSEYTGAANGGVITYDLNVDPDGELDDLTISKTSGTAHHAIDFGANIPTSSITLRNCAFGTDFSASENTSPTAEAGNETFAFRDTTGTLTVNLVGCTGNFGYYSAGVDVTIVADPATTKVTVEDSTGAMLQNARVFLETSDNGGGSGFPYQASITSLTQSSGTATCDTTTAHGLVTGDQIVIRGAQPDGYNKVASITVTDTDTFTYSVDSGLSSPATGTPIVSYVAVHGLTNSLGVIQSDKVWPASQGLSGWARKSTSSPYFVEAGISIADASSGTDLLLALQSDE